MGQLILLGIGLMFNCFERQRNREMDFEEVLREEENIREDLEERWHIDVEASKLHITNQTANGVT